MGAPMGNKNASGPHGGTPGNVQSTGGKSHVRAASSKDHAMRTMKASASLHSRYSPAGKLAAADKGKGSRSKE